MSTMQSMLTAMLLATLAMTIRSAAARAEVTSVDHRPIGRIERLDPALDEIIDSKAIIEVLADGLDWSEGPLWIPGGEYLIFSDVPQNTVYKWKEGEGISVYLTPSGYTGSRERGGETGSNGLTLDPQGRLVLCQHGDRRVARMDAPLDNPKPNFATIAGEYEGEKFNSPNDLVYHSDGSLYFTDPPYGLEQRMDDPLKELDFQGVYRVSPDGELTVVVLDLPRPNGIALSPDEKTLYVAQSHQPAKIWKAYDVKSDGSLANGRVLFDSTTLGTTRKGNPDGMKIDQRGNLIASGPGGVLILTPEGKHLGTIRVGELISNCAFGDDGSTLYMTCDRYLCRVRMKTKGLGF